MIGGNVPITQAVDFRAEFLYYGVMAVAWGVAAVSFIVWLWWCDSCGGGTSALVQSAASWAAFKLAVQFAAIALPGMHLFFTRDPDLATQNGFFNVPGFSTTVSVTPNRGFRFDALAYLDAVALAGMLGAPIAIAGLSFAVYVSHRFSTKVAVSTPEQKLPPRI